jgi:hypothetical protein
LWQSPELNYLRSGIPSSKLLFVILLHLVDRHEGAAVVKDMPEFQNHDSPFSKPSSKSLEFNLCG